MTLEEMKRANRLIKEIGEIKSLIAKFREATTIEVAVPKSGPSNPRSTLEAIHREHFEFRPIELSEHIIAALNARLAKHEADLRSLGITE
jgi:hypothetical protein